MRLHHANICDRSFQVGAKVGPAFAVLLLQAFAPGMVQERPQTTPRPAGHGGFVIDYEAGYRLCRGSAEPEKVKSSA